MRIWIFAVALGVTDVLFTVYVLFIDHAASYGNLVRNWNAIHPVVNYLIDILGRNFWRPGTDDWWLSTLLLLLCFLQGFFVGALIGWGINRGQKK